MESTNPSSVRNTTGAVEPALHHYFDSGFEEDTGARWTRYFRILNKVTSSRCIMIPNCVSTGTEMRLRNPSQTIS